MLTFHLAKPTQSLMDPMTTAPTEKRTDVIAPERADTLAGVLVERIRRTPDALAYRHFDEPSETWIDTTWAQAGRAAARWRAALAAEGLATGERVALLLRNGLEWACFDLAAQSLGLITVPLYTNDRPSNVAYILEHSGARLLLLESAAAWGELAETCGRLPALARVLLVKGAAGSPADGVVRTLAEWLPADAGPFEALDLDPNALATIVYTSGTTGRPKGVMLSHRNILWDARAGLKSIAVYPDDLFLSFLPLSHMLERMTGMYLPILTGSTVAYARSIPQLAEDLQQIRPTILIAVPRIFERVHAKLRDKIASEPAPVRALFQAAMDVGWRRFLHAQGRGPWSPGLLAWPLLERLVAAKVQQRLGGRLRFAVCGGAPLSAEVARLFIGLGIPIAQGYGLTETSPVISVNSLEDNVPESVGPPVAGVEVRLGEHDELLTRSPAVMLGYWQDPEATAATIDKEGWLHTGDQVRIERGHIFITGRLKEIIVLANGEKVPPAELEMAIAFDPLFDQVMVIGEGRPYLTALLVPEPAAFAAWLEGLGLPADAPSDDPALQQALVARVGEHLGAFPGYADILRVRLVRVPWSVDNGLMTPTMKLRRTRILERHAEDVQALYAGHD